VTVSIAVFVPLLFLLFKLASARFLITRLQADAQGYMSRTWQNSKTIETLQSLEAEIVYTDNVGAVYFFTGDYAYSVPLYYDSVNGSVRPEFKRAYSSMLEQLAQEGAFLILFNRSARLPEFPEPEILTRDLQQLMEFPDGAIYARAN
jgi:hypothetical protein